MATAPVTYTLKTPLQDADRTVTTLTFAPRLDIEMIETLVDDLGIKFDLDTGKMLPGQKVTMRDTRRLMAVLCDEPFDLLGRLTPEDYSGIATVIGPLLQGLQATAAAPPTS
jgi:hypothetical protein